MTEAQSDAANPPDLNPEWKVPKPTDLLYIGNTGNNSITVYRHDAAGNTAPLRIIVGSKTGISSPGQLSQDAAGNLYVANGHGRFSSPDLAQVLVFAHGASGNVAPIRIIAGPKTGLGSILDMTVDKATGKVFVENCYPCDNTESQFMRFGPNANGNVAPYATSAATLQQGNQLAFDSSDANIIQAHGTNIPNGGLHGVATYAKNFTTIQTLEPVFSTGFIDPHGIADDPTTKTYLVTMGDNITRFAESTDGNPDLFGNGKSFVPPIVSVLNDVCGSQLATPPGPTPYTYVVHGTQARCRSDAVVVYANNASGNDAPVRTLSGPATLMNKPFGIVEGP
jgi:hypothetical protein